MNLFNINIKSILSFLLLFSVLEGISDSYTDNLVVVTDTTSVSGTALRGRGGRNASHHYTPRYMGGAKKWCRHPTLPRSAVLLYGVVSVSGTMNRVSSIDQKPVR